MQSAPQNPDRLQPFAQYQIVDVVFNATANADTIISHNLNPSSPEHVNYIVLRKGQAADVYHDTSVTRKPWQANYLVLRSTIASAKVTLLLTVDHITRTLPF